MTDLTTKTVLQSQSGASVGLFQEVAAKQVFQDLVKGAPNSGGVEAVDKSSQQITTSGAFGAGMNSDRQNGNEANQGRKSRFTVMVRDRSGEQRVITVKASSADAAKNAAQANLEEGEEITAVSESTVPDEPDPNRGLVA